MAWNNPSEILVGGTGELQVAPLGTALPTTTTGALNAAFVGTGYTSDDGPTLTWTPAVTEFTAWQAATSVRRAFTGQTLTVACALIQWDENTLPLAFGGGVISGTTPNYRFDWPTGSASTDERAVVLDVQDGAKNYRIVMPRASVTESVAANFKRTEMAQLPITLSALAPTADPNGSPGYILSNDPSFTAGS